MANGIPGGVWHEWEVVRKLGQGSYGSVYEVVKRELSVESHAAVKVISIPQNESELSSLRSEGMTVDNARTYLRGIVDDFAGEIQLMESFKGVQNIVSVEDYKAVEKTDGVGWNIYIRMELLNPLNAYICNHELTEKDVIKLGCDICTALELCGRRNVIHRDIKPENIFINAFGDFKLGDFGIARRLENVTGGLSRKGTYYYMAPEVEKGTEYDARVDQYSLGIVLYRFTNGNCLPFLTPSTLSNPNERAASVRRRLNGESLPAPGGASPEMARIILRACSYDPDKRYPSISGMKQELLKLWNNVSDSAGAASAGDANKDMSRERHDSLNETMAVRQAQPEQKQKPIETFGVKKSGDKTRIIAIALAGALVVGAAAFALPKLVNGDSSEGSGVEDSTDDSGGGEGGEEASSGTEAKAAANIEEMDASAYDLVANGSVTLKGEVKIAVNGMFFLDWGTPQSILLTQADGSNIVLEEVSTAYLNNAGVDAGLWGLLPYDRPLQFSGTLRYENNQLVMDAVQMADANGSQIIIEQPKQQTAPASSQQPVYSPKAEDAYILPQSSTRLLTKNDVAGMTLQQINYAKNEIYARHGRMFQSKELQDYFNAQSWYVGTISASSFKESYLSSVEKQNAEFLAGIEFSISPSGYKLDAK